MEELIKAIQELGNLSWIDYVQLGLSIVTILISALALFYAIRVPKKIAKEQNNIALFEKRYEFYIIFTKSTAFVKVIEQSSVKTKENAQQLFVNMLSGKNLDNIGQSGLEDESKLLLYDVVATLGQAKYLFNLESDRSLEIFSNDLIDLFKTENSKAFQSCLNKISISMANVRSELNNIFEKQLYLDC